ncbi:anti-repressor-like protein [Ligilactobacillus agilis DSM 20509]|uniref:Anti-repressor-like protein n=3 Tax=Bacillota TaxID=1239 RepID=A0A0R2AGV6_9LACO|nr:phage antirepressor [Ruminiclostridium herbifermentans]KRM65810.1 anti-repressor-like protein [Ligilactobacillus agilis DSM 20509]
MFYCSTTISRRFNMNKLTIFNYEGNTVRTVMKDGNPWWVLKDVCSVLEIGNSRDVMARLDSDEKGVDIIDTPGGKQEVSIINESGLYSVILVSRKPEAKKFKRWVTHEVLPSIRRHGLYATDELLANPDFLIQALQELKAERAKNVELTTTISIQEQQIAEMKPKASYYDVVLNCKDAVSITTIAKDYGKSGRWFNEYLHNLGVQFRQGKIWLLYQKYAQHGYTTTKTHTYLGNDGTMHSKVHTYWTQKGRLFIYELLKDHGILPLIEQESEFEEM